MDDGEINGEFLCHERPSSSGFAEKLVVTCKNICFTAVSDNMQPAMSKTSLDFGFFCDVSQNLKAQHFLADLLGNRSLLQEVQKVMVCDSDWRILICFV